MSKPQIFTSPIAKIHATRLHRNNMLPIRMKNAGIEHTIHIQGIKTNSRTRIPHLECLIPGGRYDIVSQWADRIPTHSTRMPTQRTNQCRVWQVLEQVPAYQVRWRNTLLEHLAQVSERSFRCTSRLKRTAAMSLYVVQRLSRWLMLAKLRMSRRSGTSSGTRCSANARSASAAYAMLASVLLAR